MIVSFRSKALRLFYEDGNGSKLPAAYLKKIQRILSIVDTPEALVVLNAPGYNLHKLVGNYADFGAVKVSGNYRIIFKEEEGSVFEIDFVDYH